MSTEMKPIPSLPEYGADSDGNIWRIAPYMKPGRKYPRKLAARDQRRGYLYVYVNGKCRSVHRLVCEAFHGAPPKGHEVAHYDGTRDNNRPENLRWATPQENLLDKFRHGRVLRGQQIGVAVLSPADVEWIRAYPPRKGMFKEMADRLQVTPPTIAKAYTGENWRY